MNKKMLLGVNIDHVATLRQARGTRYPDPLQAALVAEHAGADAITLHLREDRRHIQDRDVFWMRETLQSRMNLEMAATDEMRDIACRVKPEDCCIVPESREELTTEGGLDVISEADRIRDLCGALAEQKIRVSLFIDADLAQLDMAREVGAPVIEIHTGHYADAKGRLAVQSQLDRIKQAVVHAENIGLVVNAGHGIDYHNVQPIVEIEGIQELNIGHSIVARAVFSGLSQAVADMKALLVR